MSIDRLIFLMKNEAECIRRANDCGRDCLHCELVQEDKDLKEAYRNVVDILEDRKYEEAYRNVVDILEDRKRGINMAMDEERRTGSEKGRTKMKSNGTKRENKLITRYGNYVDPTANTAVRNCAIEAANQRGNRTMSLSIDRKHKEYVITWIDGKGHKTSISRTYENEEEIPRIY